MTRHRNALSLRLFAGLLTSLLFATFTHQLAAQTAPDSQPQRPTSLAYDKAHEVTLNGNIQEVVTARTPGSPVGMHLLVAFAQRTVDAHLGPYLTKDIQQALHTGTPVQIVGAMYELHGKDYLLARQLIFGGRTVTLRSENGFLERAHSPRTAHAKPEAISEKTSPAKLNGGAR